MTAEIAILNRVGVALAADSAVSIGHKAGKIWTSAEKLFQLSEVDPVGVMVYGNADFLDLPWETIIKSYRQTNGWDIHPTIAQHAQNLTNYLENQKILFPTERQIHWAKILTSILFMDIRRQIDDALSKEAEDRNGLEEQEIPSIVAPKIDSRLAQIREHPHIPRTTREWRRGIKSLMHDHTAEIESKIFGNLPMSASSKKQLLLIADEMLVRCYMSPLISGIVVAGFGSEEYLPSIEAFEVEGMIGNRLRLRNIVQHSKLQEGMVIPFAQKEMVELFMEGIDRRLYEFIVDSTRDVLSGTLEKLVSAVSKENQLLGEKLGGLSTDVTKLSQNLTKIWRTKCKEYWEPVVANISSLPKDELAAMAEAFVNLTKFRRRVSTDRETVGGPIDVAVITKGDGFVWVKRKHYFDPTKNPRIMAKYVKK